MTNQFLLAQKKPEDLTKAFWFLAASLVIYELFTASEAFSLNIICIAITAMALLPSYLWCAGKALGMPIFPMFSITFIWTYALPLISNNQNVLDYSIDQRLFAGITTLGFLAVGCAVWFRFVKTAPIPPLSYRSLTGTKGNTIFFLALAASVFFNMASIGGWLAILALNGGAFSLLRNTVIAFTALSSFVLSYRLGKEELTPKQSRALVALLTSFMLSSALGFLLITSATVFLSSIAAFVVGRRKVPIVLMLSVVLCLSFLHAGKADMRSRYWGRYSQVGYIQPWQYPTVYGEWVDSSIKNLSLNSAAADSSVQSRETFGDRASVIHMMMLSQSLSPQPLPFLKGYTYQILPEMLVPRLLYPEKPWSHEGTYRLNIYYGRQTKDETRRTTIAWGLLAEAYANFGILGCVGLAGVLGSLYGFVSRLSINAPILSLQSLIAVFLMTYAIQSEWTASVYVAALSQHAVVLMAIAVFLMKKRPNEELLTAYNYFHSPNVFSINSAMKKR
ncbi:MAG: hypothetical protein WA885_21195 [Phormidesmis sp.]